MPTSGDTVRLMMDALAEGPSDLPYIPGIRRTRRPEDTLADFGRFARHFGITRLANITGLDRLGIPTCLAVRPNARTLAVSQGKGPTLSAAKASAFMESAELWHAEEPRLPLVLESYASMQRRGAVVDVDLLAKRTSLPIRRDDLRLWVEGFDLIREQPCWVPAAAVYVSDTEPPPTDLYRSTNGLASGNTVAEAIVHAACELIERDAKVMWLDDPSDPDGKVAQLDMSTVSDPTCRDLITRLEQADLLFAAYDITSDIGLPVFAAVVADTAVDARGVGYNWGYGCHPAPEVALVRALTEAAQARLTIIAGSRDDLPDTYDLRGDNDIDDVARMIQQPAPTRRFDQVSRAGASPAADFRTAVDRLRAAEIRNLVAVDLSHPDVGMPVVKLLATELELHHGDCVRNVRAQRRHGLVAS